MKPGIISDSITLHFANTGVKDKLDLMRCNIFATDIEMLTLSNGLYKENIEHLSSYHGVMNNVISMDDAFIDTLIEKAEYLYTNF